MRDPLPQSQHRECHHQFFRRTYPRFNRYPKRKQQQLQLPQYRASSLRCNNRPSSQRHHKYRYHFTIHSHLHCNLYNKQRHRPAFHQCTHNSQQCLGQLTPNQCIFQYRPHKCSLNQQFRRVMHNLRCHTCTPNHRCLICRHHHTCMVPQLCVQTRQGRHIIRQPRLNACNVPRLYHQIARQLPRSRDANCLLL